MAARARRKRGSASDWRSRSGPSRYLIGRYVGRNVASLHPMPQGGGGGKYADHEARERERAQDRERGSERQRPNDRGVRGRNTEDQHRNRQWQHQHGEQES